MTVSWEEPPLFDPGPPDPGRYVAETKPSYTRRLTIWRNDQLAKGIHPVTGYALLGDDTSTCGNCAYRRQQGGTAGTYHKCELNSTGGPKTDLRLHWPACTHHQPETP